MRRLLPALSLLAASGAACGAFVGGDSSSGSGPDAGASADASGLEGGIDTEDGGADAGNAAAADGATDDGSAASGHPNAVAIWTTGTPTIIRAGATNVYWLDDQVVRGLLGGATPYATSATGKTLYGLAFDESAGVVFAVNADGLFSVPAAMPFPLRQVMMSLGLGGVAHNAESTFVTSTTMGLVYACTQLACDDGFAPDTQLGTLGVIGAGNTMGESVLGIAGKGGAGNTTVAGVRYVPDPDASTPYLDFGTGSFVGMPIVRDVVIVRAASAIAVATDVGPGRMSLGGFGSVAPFGSGKAVAIAVVPGLPPSPIVYVAYADHVASYDLSANDAETMIASGFKSLGGIAANATDLYIADTGAGVVYRQPR